MTSALAERFTIRLMALGQVAMSLIGSGMSLIVKKGAISASSLSFIVKGWWRTSEPEPIFNDLAVHGFYAQAQTRLKWAPIVFCNLA